MARAHFTPVRGRRRMRAAFCASLGGGIAAVALATGAGAAAPGPGASIDAPSLPPAESWSKRGVDPALADEEGMVRVRVILRDQALLAAASDPTIQAQLQTAPAASSRTAAADHPGRITGIEKADAREAEGNYEDAVDDLQPAAAETGDDVDQVAAQIRRSGGEVLDSEIVPAAVIARIPAGELEDLERLGSVAAVEDAPKPKPQSSVGWQAVGAPAWHSAGFTGGGGTSDTVPADAGVLGELPDPTHPAFAGVTVDNDPTTPVVVGDHGTHTASIIASQDTINRGVAYGLDRLVNGNQEYQLGFTRNGVPGAGDPAEVINTSFGSSETDDNEGDGDDVTTAFFGVSQALSAGNENVSGSPTVQNMGRNTMSVAAFNDVGTVASTDDVVLGTSSRGPTPAGRKKPDLTAPGGAVVAASSFWNSPPSNPDYTGMTGTSFSSPHVAGAMTLLEGSGITDPMAQRALLINSARDWNGTNTGLHGWTSGTQTGWRPEVGWGELDLTTALAQRANYRLGTVDEGEATFYRATVPAGSKATMAFQLRGFFTGYPGPPFPVQSTKYTVSNLDLHQYDSSDAEVLPPPAFDPPDTTIDPGPNAIDPNDTVEQVRSPVSPGSQTVTYKIQSASTIDGATSEPFAIAAAAPLIPLASPTVRPNSLAASSSAVRCNQPVTITTTARNDSPDLAAANAALAIELPAGVQLVSGATAQTVSGGTLATSTTSESHAWTVQATSDGPKTITVRGAGDAYGTTFRDADQVTIAADCTPPGTSISSGPVGATNDSTPSFTFSGTGSPTSFECSIDSGAFAPCSSPFTAPALGDGPHSFAVRAIDAVGNADPSPPLRTFTVDTLAPDTSIGSGPSGAVRSRSASFALAGGAGFECSLDGGPYAPCGSPATFSGLAEGRHTFAARAIDAAGNVDASPANRAFSVDTEVSGAKLAAKKKQRFKGKLGPKLKVTLGESGTISAKASGKAGSKKVKLSAAKIELRDGGRGTLRLVASRRTARVITAALERRSVKLAVKVTFTDELGNRKMLKRTVKLRG